MSERKTNGMEGDDRAAERGEVERAEVESVERQPEQEQQEPRLRPHIYVASLADYNAGYLHGEWLDATQPVKELQGAVRAMLARSPLTMQGEAVEEWAIHDTDDFGELRIGEHADLAEVHGHAVALAKHGPSYAAWWELNGMGTVETFEDDYIGEFDSLEAYAQEYGADSGWESILDEAVPSYLRPYVSVDYDQLARDLDYSGDVYTARRTEGGVWVFRG